MSEKSHGGTFRVETGVGPAKPSDELSARPFHVALLGDFSARSARGEVGDSAVLTSRAPIQIDRDDLDSAMARLCPALELALPGSVEVERLCFAKLDDFHPDSLVDEPALFGDLRSAIADPAAFAQFRAELQKDSAERLKQTDDDSPAPAVTGNLLDQILDDAPTQAPSTALEDGGLQEFVKRVVAPHQVPTTDTTQAELLAQLDEQMGSRMRWVLHRPEFQALEALWRVAYFLCRRIETSATLKLFLIDVSKEELLSDQGPDVPLEESGLYELLVESSVGTPGAIPWSLLVGCYSFGPDMDDMKLLARLGAITSLANAAWLVTEPVEIPEAPVVGMIEDHKGGS